MERHASHDLHVVVALAERAFGGLAYRGEGLDHEVVERFAVGETLFELGCLGLQLLVGKGLEFGFERVDLSGESFEVFEGFAFADAKELVEERHG